MTARAVEAAVLRVVEIEPDRRRRIGDRIPRPEFVTRRTFPDVVLADGLSGRMALKARDVGRIVRRDRHPGSLRSMARSAIRFLEMGLVIEIHLETADRRKRLEFRAPLLFVTDDADRMLRIVELLSVTSGAGNVRREADLRRIIVSLVAEKTRQVLMARTVVLEL